MLRMKKTLRKRQRLKDGWCDGGCDRPRRWSSWCLVCMCLWEEDFFR